MNKICVFGDSIARGVVFDKEKGRYVFLKDSFANLFASSAEVELKNFAKFGCTISKGEEIVAANLDEAADADITVLEFGGNDCDLNWSEISKNPEIAHFPKTVCEDFISKYIEIVQKIKNAGGQPIILSLPPLSAKNFFEHVSKGLSKENILKFLGNVEYIYRWHESYNMSVFRVGVLTQTPVLDIRSLFLSDRNYETLICEDGMHPNEKGHEIIFKKILEAKDKYHERFFRKTPALI